MDYRFAAFRYEPDQRRLTRDGVPIELSSRYLDALSLLLAEPGSLVTKDRFMDEVWRGVPVTDEALTQAIRALRKALGDDAANPRFIETVPKHGYRFVAPLDATARPDTPARPALLPLALAGGAGGALAGLIGGLAYGLAGGGSLLLVLVALTALLGTLGGGAIGLGIGIARALAGRSLASDALGGAAGGLVIGALARLLGIDAFTLFFGAAPTTMTGAFEGLLLGGAVGLAVGSSPAGKRLSMLRGAVAGGGAGLLIGLMGGRLMGGSLALLDATFPGGALGLDWVGWFGSSGLTAALLTGLEGAIFGAAACLTLSSIEKRIIAA